MDEQKQQIRDKVVRLWELAEYIDEFTGIDSTVSQQLIDIIFHTVETMSNENGLSFQEVTKMEEERRNLIAVKKNQARMKAEEVKERKRASGF